jgi:hypothetical protein
MAAGSTPEIGMIDPSSASSPTTAKPSSASEGMAPIAAMTPSAIGKS